MNFICFRNSTKCTGPLAGGRGLAFWAEAEAAANVHLQFRREIAELAAVTVDGVDGVLIAIVTLKGR